MIAYMKAFDPIIDVPSEDVDAVVLTGDDEPSVVVSDELGDSCVDVLVWLCCVDDGLAFLLNLTSLSSLDLS